MRNWIRRHPLIAALAAFAFGAAPQWIASVWSLFSSEPLVPWLARHNVPTLPFSPLWVTGSISVILIAAIFFVVQRQNQPMVHTKKLEQGRSPQPIIVAIDELKALRYEGERLVGRFQEDSVKPTFGEVENWRKRTRDCARQNTLASLVTAKDLLTLEKPWDEGEVLRITAKFLDHGCFLDGSTQMAVFQHLWGQVMSRSAGKRALPENTESRQQTVTQIGQREAQAIRDPHGYVDSRWKRHHSAIPDREPGDLHREDEGNTDNDPLRSSEPKQKKRRQPRTQRDETVVNRGRTVSKGYQTRVRNLLFRRQKSEVSFRSMSKGFQMVGFRGSTQEKSPLRISRSG